MSYIKDSRIYFIIVILNKEFCLQNSSATAVLPSNELHLRGLRILGSRFCVIGNCIAISYYKKKGLSREEKHHKIQCIIYKCHTILCFLPSSCDSPTISKRYLITYFLTHTHGKPISFPLLSWQIFSLYKFDLPCGRELSPFCSQIQYWIFEKTK